MGTKEDPRPGLEAQLGLGRLSEVALEETAQKGFAGRRSRNAQSQKHKQSRLDLEVLFPLSAGGGPRDSHNVTVGKEAECRC